MKKIVLSLMMVVTMFAAASCACNNNSAKQSENLEKCSEADACADEKCSGCDSSAVKDSCCRR